MSTRLFTAAAACLATCATAVLLAAGVAVATHDAQTLHACAANSTGALRLVMSDEGCFRNEFAVEWSKQGPPGAAITCGAGTRYFVGVCLDETARAAKQIGDASDDCADEAGRLPTSAEMRAFRRQPGITITGAEWSSDMGDHEGIFRFLAFTQNGDGLESALSPLAYRCVTAPVG